MSTEKKYRRSAISVICYILAALMLVYVCYTVGSTVSTINEYYAQYGMSAKPSEYVTYIMQSALDPFIHTVMFFMFGFILDAVRKNNPANYMSDADIEDKKNAKKEAKDSKKFAKGEVAAEKAGHKTTEESSVEADFAKSLEEELKSDAAASQKPKTQRKPRSNSQKKTSGSSKAAENKTKAADSKTEEKKSGSTKSGGSGKGKSQSPKGASKKTTKPAQKKTSTAPKKETKKENSAVASKEEAEKAADGFAVVIEEGKE